MRKIMKLTKQANNIKYIFIFCLWFFLIYDILIIDIVIILFYINNKILIL